MTVPELCTLAYNLLMTSKSVRGCVCPHGCKAISNSLTKSRWFLELECLCALARIIPHCFSGKASKPWSYNLGNLLMASKRFEKYLSLNMDKLCAQEQPLCHLCFCTSIRPPKPARQAWTSEKVLFLDGPRQRDSHAIENAWLTGSSIRWQGFQYPAQRSTLTKSCSCGSIISFQHPTLYVLSLSYLYDSWC